MLRAVIFLLHSGHFLIDRTAVSIQFLQKTWPHVVVQGSRVRTSSRQTGHLYTTSVDWFSSSERVRLGDEGLVLRGVCTELSRRLGFALAGVSWRRTRREVSGEHRSMMVSGERILADCGEEYISKLDRSIISIGSTGNE